MAGTKKAAAETRRRTLIVVGGGKGGVGKSIGTQAVVDTLLYAEGANGNADQIFVIETDTSNPDVFKVYKEHSSNGKQDTWSRVKGAPEVISIALDDESGFVLAGNAIEDLDHAKIQYVVVNSAARTTDSFVRYESFLRDVATQSGMDCRMLWLINRQRDSLELLKQWMDAVKKTSWKTTVVRNTYFGSPDKFLRFNDGPLKNRVHAVVDLPELTDLVADKLVANRLGLWNAGEQLSVAERSALARFRLEAHAALMKGI